MATDGQLGSRLTSYSRTRRSLMGDWSWDDIKRGWTRDADDRVRQVAWHLLSTLDDRITDAFVGEECPSGLDGECLLDQGWSETERMTAAAAWALYRGSGPVNLGRLARFFSDVQLKRLLEALEIYRGDRAPNAPGDP